MPQHAQIIAPVVALVAWSLVMWLWMYVTRIPAMNRAGIDARNLVGGSGADLKARLDPKAQWPAENYNHLMEQPTIFYAITLSLAMLGAGGGLNATIAWVYVGLRIAHSLVQATINRVVVRFSLFVLSTLCLLMLTVHAAFVLLGWHHL
ncbi:MAG: hypothetical protein B7Y45_13430 [Sphingomonas sp. 28-66-16]|nr:MAG: hypothetical protein B7Y45_13430 [Sphingomonas sp. 28-66-16]